MKSLKLNLLEGKEMNLVRGGVMQNCHSGGSRCDYSSQEYDYARASYEQSYAKIWGGALEWFYKPWDNPNCDK